MKTYRVEELAAAADVKVDTVRFYQARGLLPAPRRVNRSAVYTDEHLARIRKIRRYQTQGLSLAVIRKVLDNESRSTVGALLDAVADESGACTLTRAEVAKRSGVPEALLAAVEGAGLLRPMLKAWLDDNLPGMVERMVRAEIERVSRGRG